MNEITISTHSNVGLWIPPAIGISCDAFLYSTLTVKMYGVQFAKNTQNREEITALCHEITEKVHELFKMVNDESK
jgi:hypothetical protein